MQKFFYRFVQWLFTSSFTIELNILRERSLRYILQNVGAGFTLDNHVEVYDHWYIPAIVKTPDGYVTYTSVHKKLGSITPGITIEYLPVQTLVQIAEAIRTNKVIYHPLNK